MTTQFVLVITFFCLLGLVVLLSSKDGSKAAQLEVLKQEIKKRAEEQARAQKILNRVTNMPVNDMRKRLQDIAKN